MAVSEEKIIEIIADRLGIDEGKITPDASFIDDLGWGLLIILFASPFVATAIVCIYLNYFVDGDWERKKGIHKIYKGIQSEEK